MRPHHLRAVGRNREPNTVVDERPEHRAHRILVRKRLRQEVRRGADLEDDLGVAQLAHQLCVAGGEDALTDSIRPQDLEHLAYLLPPEVAALLADVDRHAEPGRPRLVDHRLRGAVVVPRVPRAWAGEVDADDPARRPHDRLLDDDLVLPRREGPIHHQDEAGADLRIFEARAVETTDSGEDDVIELALAAAVALHRVEPQLERRDAL